MTISHILPSSWEYAWTLRKNMKMSLSKLRMRRICRRRCRLRESLRIMSLSKSRMISLLRLWGSMMSWLRSRRGCRIGWLRLLWWILAFFMLIRVLSFLTIIRLGFLVFRVILGLSLFKLHWALFLIIWLCLLLFLGVSIRLFMIIVIKMTRRKKINLFQRHWMLVLSTLLLNHC
jgi:hypothetical protein